jgi:hypothetical protein
LREDIQESANAKIMVTPTLVRAIGKLAAAGERPGFTLEEMIQLLDSGLSVETLLELIARRLEAPPLDSPRPTNWIV